jgi:Uma2 family endonuclease
MAAAAQQVVEVPVAAATMTRHLFTVEDFERMGEVGIFTEDDRVELIEGEIVAMAAKNDPHVLCLVRCIRLVTAQLTDDLWLAVQDPVRLSSRSKPEPDFLVYRMVAAMPGTAPTAANTLLVAEVADSSLVTDRSKKLPLYARAGIPETWLFDLVNKRIERHTDPSPAGYRLMAVANRGESLTSTMLPGLTIAVDDVIN